MVGTGVLIDDVLADVAAAEPLAKGITALAQAISEVRRISRDLRPGILNDLGLGPALKTLADEFAARTGIDVSYNSVVFRNRLDNEAKIALYRIAQEALTNIERHAGASDVAIDLDGYRTGGDDAHYRQWGSNCGAVPRGWASATCKSAWNSSAAARNCDPR